MKTIGIILAVCLFVIGFVLLMVQGHYNTTNWCIVDYPREITGGNVVYCGDFIDYTLDYKGYKRRDNTSCIDKRRATEEEYKLWLNGR